jgi:hypothetical protein
MRIGLGIARAFVVAAVVVVLPWQGTTWTPAEPIALGPPGALAPSMLAPAGMSGAQASTSRSGASTVAALTEVAAPHKSVPAAGSRAWSPRQEPPSSPTSTRQRTRAFWSARAGTPVDDDGAREIETNIVGFFRVLQDWDNRS